MNKTSIQVGMIGTGMIGMSLAALFTGNGYPVVVYGIDQNELDSGLLRYRQYYRDLIENELVTPRQAEICESLLTFTTNYRGLSEVSLVFECVVEKLSVKYSVYERLEKHCKKLQAIASSTSAISADDLADGLEAKELLAVAHPWNPPHLVPCVEVVKSRFTSENALKLIVDTLSSVGREVVVMKSAAPGFIGNRLQHALFREAVNLVEKGIASPEDIDRTLRSSFIPRYTSIGLFQHQDYAGLDMVKSIEDYLFPTLSNANQTPDLINRLYEEGNLGFKTGKGVLDWSEVDINAFRKKASEPYLRFFNWRLP